MPKQLQPECLKCKHLELEALSVTENPEIHYIFILIIVLRFYVFFKHNGHCNSYSPALSDVEMGLSSDVYNYSTNTDITACLFSDPHIVILLEPCPQRFVILCSE